MDRYKQPETAGKTEITPDMAGITKLVKIVFHKELALHIRMKVQTQ